MQRIDNAYVSYGEYFLDYNTKTFELKIGFGKTCITAHIKSGIFENYKKSDIKYKLKNTKNIKTVVYKNGETSLTLIFEASARGIGIKKKGDAQIAGIFNFDSVSDVIAVRMSKNSPVFRCSCGLGASKSDNALFDKNTDTAYVAEGCTLGFDSKKNAYTIFCDTQLKFRVEKDVYANKYHIKYAKINKNNTFGKNLPVGFMTWYAVKFDAGEKTVLENALFQKEHLKDFGANTVWVDWEWYHKGFDADSVRSDGVDTFNPDKEKYPNGLKYVSDKIREMGFIPSLWIGPTNETFETDYLKANPDVLLAKEQCWVGTYFYDITHPKFLNDFLPKALSMVDKWGYDAVKFDTLPICAERCEEYHERLYNSEITTYGAYRNMIAKTREILGKDRYILSCSGDKRSDVLWAADMFDAARIGLDIFKWEEFLQNCVYRTMEFYPLHNVVLYNDPDNVVVRSEFNTLNQAISRATFVSMLGMPVTFGDAFRDLDEKRVDILKRVIPPLDISPKDISARVDKRDVCVTNLFVNKKFENYNVVSVFNTTDKKCEYTLDFENELELDGEKYHIYDFWNDKYLGTASGKISLSLNACETRLLSVRPKKDIPQIISTNRHITQGAQEIEDMRFEENTLFVRANLVKNDEYKIAVYVPDIYRVSDCGALKAENDKKYGNVKYFRFVPKKNDCYEFKIKFEVEL